MNILELDSYKLSDAVKFNKELNPRIWQNNKMRPEVRAKLLEIAQDFREFLGLSDLEIKDIVVSGSNASYTYTPHSDIDLHLVADIPQADLDDVYRELFDAKKYQYNDLHDIKIGGHDVELYVENANKPAVSQGNYSLIRNDWNSIPKQRRSTVDDDAVRSKYEDLQHRIDTAIQTGDEHTINALATKIRSMRQAGLDRHGELGAENLAYKMLRTQGYIRRLYDARNQARDAELSLPEQGQPVTYGFRSQVDEVGLTPDGVNPTTCMIVNEKESPSEQDMVEDFVQYCARELGLQRVPNIKLRRDPEWSVRHMTFGRYTDELNRLEVGTANRHIMDILRTVAHELVHRHQHETQDVPADAGHTGSPEENEANARAGILMRGYAEQHPEYFEHGALEESASGYIPTRRQAHDPRYEMALTQDIQPGQVGREANKLKLKTNSQGQPKIAKTNGLVESLSQELAHFKSGMLEEEILDEVAMSPTALRDWARSSAARGIQAGFEAELIFRGLGSGDDSELEPDYDQDRSADSISDIVDFFDDGEYNSSSNIRRLENQLREDYLLWLDDRSQEVWSEVQNRRIVKWVRENYDPESEALDMVAGENPDLDPDSAEFRDLVEAKSDQLMDQMIEVALEDPANEYHEEALDDWREDYFGEDQESQWLEDEGIDSMSGIENNYNIRWPYYTSGSTGGSRDADDIGASLQQVVGMPVTVSGGYHSTKRTPGTWIIEPDSSLDPDDDEDGGREIVSPPMPLDQALAKLTAVIDWANDPEQGDAYTNQSTGLHMGVSIPDRGGDVDYTKLILFMGDQYVLQKFGREANTFCKSALENMQSRVKSGQVDPAKVLQDMRDGLNGLASKAVQGATGTSKYTSAHIKPGYIEFRSPGGDYLAEANVDMDALENTMLRFARAMQIAGDPQAERQEYAKKLYKLVAPEGNDALKYFSQYAAGELPRQALKSFIRQTQLQRQVAKGSIGGAPTPQADLGQTDMENRLGMGSQSADANYEIVDRRTMQPVFLMIAMTPQDAERKYRDWLTAAGHTQDTQDYAWRERTTALPGSTLDRARQRDQQPASAATSNVTNPLWRDQLRSHMQASTPGLAAFTGRWLVKDTDTGQVLHTISGIGNAQADANRYAAQWFQHNAPRGSNITQIEVVPEMQPVTEDAVRDLEQDLRRPRSYKAIDHVMRGVSQVNQTTPKKLHDRFVDKHGEIPDEWVKKLEELVQAPEVIEEGATSVLYHYTSVNAANQILASGQFQLSSSMGTAAEYQYAPEGYNYFLSTSRVKSGDYARYVGSSGVMFVLDGDWLGRRYPVKPIDYWERAWLQSDGTRTRESEDRVFSREPEIPIACVREMHVLIKEQHEYRSPQVRKIMIQAKKQGIPAYLYSDESAWRLQDRRRAITPQQAKELLRGPEPQRTTWPARTYLDRWLELIFKNKKSDLSPPADKLRYDLQYYSADGDHQLGVDLSNARKPDAGDHYQAVKIIDYMRRNRLNRPADLVDAMRDKWKAAQ